MSEVMEGELLHQVCSLLLKAHEEPEVFEQIAEQLRRNLQVSCCSIWLASPNGGVGQQRVAFSIVEDNMPADLPTLDFKEAFQAMGGKGALNWQESQVNVEKQRLLSLTKPLSSHGHMNGAICFWFVDGAIRKHIVSLITSLAADLAQGLDNYRNFSDPSHRRLNKEVEIAKQIQTSFLPKKTPQLAGNAIAFQSMTAHEVGGDYLDIFHTQNKLVGIALGDVMGKGIPAALWVAMTRVTLGTIAKSGVQPHVVLEEVNKALYQDLVERDTFVTLLYALYEPVKRVLLLANAGHLPPLVFHSTTGQYELLKVKGAYIGGIENRKYQLAGVQLIAGDVVLFYSDGLTEATNSSGEQFGLNKVVDVVRKNSLFDAQQIVDRLTIHISQYIGNYLQKDDITFACLKVG